MPTCCSQSQKSSNCKPLYQSVIPVEWFQDFNLDSKHASHGIWRQRTGGFDKWTLSVGNGESDILKIPDQMIATIIKPNSKENPHAEDEAMHDFCEKIFPDLLQNITDRNFIEGRALLASTNHEVKLLNEHLSSKLPGSPDVLRSADQLQNPQDALRFNVEYLNTLNPNGFPPHTLFLKPGMPLMLLRNLNPKEGLCNGTKLIYERTIDRKILECKLYGSERTVFIPRIALIPKEGEYPFHWSRLQFPVKVAFAMTINKAQGKYLSIFPIGITVFFRTNSEGCWVVAAIRPIYPWTAVCRDFQSWKAPVSEVCSEAGHDWNLKTSSK